MRSGRKADYADKDVEKILRSYIAPAPEAEGEQERKVHVVGGDYFSQAQYKDVGRADDNIFTRFAVKVKSDSVKDERTGSDIADRYATETLAEIFAEQGCIEEARRIYSRLILDNPEKSAYFAESSPRLLTVASEMSCFLAMSFRALLAVAERLSASTLLRSSGPSGEA